MNCRNCVAYLREALDSVYEQTFKDYEIIFWDNLSTDNSAEIALNYGKPLRYFKGDESLPLGAARNAAIKKAAGELIAFLDCDDVWLPDKLARQVKLLESNEKLGLVYTDCCLIDDNSNLIEDRTAPYSHIHHLTGNTFDRLFDQGNFIPMVTVMIRKAILADVGVFNPSYEICEEYELWLRIAAYYPIDFIDKPLARYRRHSSNLSDNKPLANSESLQIIEYWKNRKPELKKWYSQRVRRRKSLLHFRLLRFYFRNNQRIPILKELLNLIILLPHSLVILSRAIKRLAE